MYKSISFSIAVTISCVFVHAQTTDKVVRIKGDTLKVIVSNVSANTITYSYPNESVTTTINRKIVKQIIYKSGRVEDISAPLIIKSEQDYQKVIVTKDPNEVIGLVKISDVTGKAMKAFGNENKLRIEATEELKKDGARKGAFIILIQIDNFERSPLNNVSITGVAYGY